MELRQLKYFLATAEMLSFSKAAERLFITQSTLSQQIRTLEDELGAPLFRRTSHSVQLTEAGEILRPIAEITCRDAESCKTQIHDLKTGLSGKLSIGVTHTCSGILTKPLREFIRLYPKVEIELHYTNSQTIRDLLHQRQVDFALAIRPDVLPDTVQCEDLFTDHLCAICSHTHALANCKSVTLSQLRSSSLALPSKDLHARRAIDSLISNSGISLQPRIEINAPDRLFDLVEHSQMLTIYAGITVKDRSGLVAIPISDCQKPLIGSIFTMANTYKKRSTEVLISMLRSQAELLQITI